MRVDERTLDQLGEFLESNPERKVRIEGFTDSIGSDEYNSQLSARRAETVKSALMSKGIEGARVTTRGYGETYAVASNDNASGRQLNRRVEVIIANDDGEVQARQAVASFSRSVDRLREGMRKRI